jgi:hypothetical protein
VIEQSDCDPFAGALATTTDWMTLLLGAGHIRQLGQSCLSARPPLDRVSGDKRLDMPEDTITEAFRYTGHEELEQVRLIQRYNRHIADLFLAAVEPGQALLDFGAGIGTISTLVRERALAADILCVEIDANNVATLKREGFDVITDATKVPANSVDLVYSSKRAGAHPG